MGEAAEWEIFRRYGVDISDDGHLSRRVSSPGPNHQQRSKMMDDPFDEILRNDPEWTDPERQRSAAGMPGNMSERTYMIHMRGLPNDHRLVVFKDNHGSRAGAFRVDQKGNYYWQGSATQKGLVADLIQGKLPLVKPGQAYRTARGVVTNALRWHPNEGFHLEGFQLPVGNETSVIDQIANYHKQRSTPVDKTKEAITLMQITNGAKIVAAAYQGETNRQYHFKNVLGLDLEAGDLIVVETRGQYSLATVADPDVDVTAIGCGYDQLVHVAAKVDLAALKSVLASEGRARHQLAMSEVHDRLSTFRKQLGDAGFTAAQNALLGKADPEDAEVVED